MDTFIAFVSTKFSGAGMRWDIAKKEAYAIYFAVKELAYYLECKAFVIETDHANLVWIEKSDASIVIRWRLFLQGFIFQIKHIPGKANVFADMLSRMYLLDLPVLSSASEETRSMRYIRESMSAKTLALPGMCLIWKVKP